MSRAQNRWWSCPLDVEQLALGAVESACSATRDLAARRGIAAEVSTSPELVAASFAAIEHLRIDGRPASGWAPMSGFLEARDGWVRLHANYPHHSAAITSALGATTRNELVDAVRERTAQDVEDAVTGAGGVATVVRTARQWNEHPHGRSTAGDLWHQVEGGAYRPPLLPAALPLSGVRVLDLTRLIAGPSCSQLLACLGADVLRIDPPDRPELLDQYLSNGMGKRSAEADLSRVLGTVHTELLPRADVVLLGYRPGALDRFGLSARDLSAEHPAKVIASLSAWGEQGPWGQRAGFDSIVQAASGIAYVCIRPDGRPGALPVQALDHATGYSLAAGVISLLAQRRGGIVRASLLGAARTLLDNRRNAHDHTVTLDLPTVSVRSPYGRLRTVPPPLMLNRRTLSRDIGGYATSPLSWH